MQMQHNTMAINATKTSTTAAVASPKQGTVAYAKWMSPKLAEKPKYHVTKVLGSGGYSNVFQAESQVNKEQVAVKQVTKEPAHPEEIEILEYLSLEQEQLNASPGAPLRVTALKEVQKNGDFQNGGQQYLVLSLCQGGTLQQAQRKAPALFAQEESMLKPLARHLLQTLGWTHSLGVYNLDLKLENLLFESQIDWTATGADAQRRDLALQQVVMSDLGLATTQTCLASYRGTPGYVAPEMIQAEMRRQSRQQAAAVDCAKCDMFSFGVIVAELRSKRNPFGASTARGAIDNTLQVDAMLRNMNGAPAQGLLHSPSGLLSASAELKDFLSRLLTSDPEARMSAAEALAHPWMQ